MTWGPPEEIVSVTTVSEPSVARSSIVPATDSTSTTAWKYFRGTPEVTGASVKAPTASSPSLRPVASKRTASPPDAVTRGQLEAIADGAAGVARRGIQALHAAAQIATEREHGCIREPDIKACFERARKRIRVANLESLPFHHQVLYALLYEAGAVTGRELHDRYDAVAETVYAQAAVTPIGARARREKLRKLESYGLIEQDGETRWRRYAVCDEAVAPTAELLDDVTTLTN